MKQILTAALLLLAMTMTEGRFCDYFCDRGTVLVI